MRAPLHLATAADAAPESSARRARQLHAEAQVVANDAFAIAYADLVRAAQALGECADLEPLHPGLREVARSTVDWLDGQFLTIDGVRARITRRKP